jgi:ubiquinone/menaquinone biosynthesis C-methylase UbiE
MKALDLLPPHALVKTGPVDHADWNHKSGILGMISRQRFQLCLSLMRGQRFDRLLEIGYGSGVFFPELAKRAQQLYGIDTHDHVPAVSRKLAQLGIQAQLHTGSAECLPFADAHFDALVAISALEFISDLDTACREISRVMAPRGRFYVLTPGISPLVDAGFNLLTGKKADEDFANRRQEIRPTLKKYFSINKQLSFPAVISDLACLYDAFELIKR